MDTVKSTLKNIRNSSKAALDLGAVMIAVVVLGIIGAVTAATVFVVIPWMQDSSAKQALSSISSAQESYKTAYDVYGNLNNLIEKDLLNSDAKLCTTASADGTSYTSASKSDTGKVFISDSSDRNPRQASPGTSTCFGVLGNGGVFTPNPTNTQNPGTTPPPNGNVPKPPATPEIKAAWNGTTKNTTGSMVNSPYCEAGNVLEYRWKSVSTNTTTPGTWSSFSSWSTTNSLSVTANYGTKYDFQAELRCRNTTTNVTSDTQASNVASVITPIPEPGQPTVTATELSTTQTRWDWASTCVTGTKVYSWADWQNGSYASNPLNYSADTTSTSRTRTTSGQGYTYSVNVKVKCQNALTASDWSDPTEAKYTRVITAPAVPTIKATWNATTVQTTGSIVTAPTCATGTSLEYRWRYAATRTTTAGSWKTFTGFDSTAKTYVVDANYGTQYDFQTEARCRNVDTGAVTDSKQSAPASVTTTIPTPTTLNIAATELSTTQTRWDWDSACPTYTTPAYSWADWQNGSYASNPLNYSADTTSETRTRTTSGQGYTYSVNVKVKCETGLVSSSWSGSKEARYTRTVNNPATPTVVAGWDATNRKASSQLSNMPYCGAGVNLEYRWRYATTTTTTAGTWTTYGAFDDTNRTELAGNYGTKFDFQLQLRCRNRDTSVDSGMVDSNVSTVTSPIPTPSKPSVTAAVVDSTNTKWTWSVSCPTATTPVYSYGDWRDGKSTENNAITYSSDTTATSRTRDTSKQGYNYSVNVKAKCKTGLVTSGWSDSNDAKWLRNIATPAAPGMNASVSDTGMQEYADLSWGSNTTCGSGTSVRFFWSIAREQYLWQSGDTTAKTGASNAYDGYTYTWAAKAKCVNTDSSRESAWSGTSSVVREVAVRPPKFSGWNFYRSGSNTIYAVPLVSCRSVVVRIGDMTPGSWSSPNVWTSGPKTGQLGWWTDNGWQNPGARDSNSNFYTGAVYPGGSYAPGSVFSAKGSFYCYNDISGKYSSRVYNDSGGWAAP